MKSNQEILDKFGARLINDCFDPTYLNMIAMREREVPMVHQKYSNLFKSLSEEDFEILKEYFEDTLKGILFNYLRIFEEYEEFKIYFEENNRKTNLVEISEMLKAEPIIENGWVERFSKKIK